MRIIMLLPAIVTLAAGAAVTIVYCGDAVAVYGKRIDTYSELVAFAKAVGFACVGLCAALTALHSLGG